MYVHAKLCGSQRTVCGSPLSVCGFWGLRLSHRTLSAAPSYQPLLNILMSMRQRLQPLEEGGLDDSGCFCKSQFTLCNPLLCVTAVVLHKKSYRDMINMS